MTQFPAIFSLVLLAALLVYSSSPPTSEHGCSTVIVSFSQCLPYISSSPNNFSAAPSSQCCHVVSSAFDSGDGVCFCYLIRQPHLLGFPVDESKIYSLSSLCSETNATAIMNVSVNTNSSIEVLCSASVTLPPMRSPTAGLWLPNRAGIEADNSSSSLVSLPPESSKNSSAPPSTSETAPSSSSEPATDSFAPKLTINNNSSSSSSSSRFLPGIVISLAATFTIFQ